MQCAIEPKAGDLVEPAVARELVERTKTPSGVGERGLMGLMGLMSIMG